VGLSAAAAVAAGALFWVVTRPSPRFQVSDEASLANGDPEHGALMFAAADCASCHASPGQSDQLRLGGGTALASPFGTLRPPNISSDMQDGIGAWSAVDIANALMSGVSPQGQHYYPAFPYTSYSHARLEDVRDLIAYLRTLPAVQGRPPPHELSFPFTIRRLVGFWKLLYFDDKPFQEDPARSPAWNRGHYLTAALTHCAECHSSRDVLGGLKPETLFAGGQNPEGVGFAPNITPGRLARWSENDLADFLASGRTPEGRIAGASMADVILNTATLPDADRQAIAVYVKALPPRATPTP
jgi:mono/diheme cytochrome c family protein